MKKERRKHLVTPAVIPAAVFFVLVFLGFTASTLKTDTVFSDNENRFLALKPELSPDAVLSGEFGEAYEEYLGDQFPLRNQWIGLKAHAELAVGKREVNHVFFGKDHYLFRRYTQEDADMDSLERLLDETAGFLADCAEKLGSERVKLMLVPDASQVLTDKVPENFMDIGWEELLDRTDSKWKESGIDYMVIDVLPMLQAHQDEYIYYRTDHHWTTLGAYYGYQAWAAEMNLDPELLTSFIQEKVTGDFCGTLHSRVNIGVVPDEITVFRPEKPLEVSLEYNQGSKITDSFYEMSHLKGKDKYAMFLDGNQALIKITNEQAALSGRKLMLIKDSYANCFVPFLAAHYEAIHVVDLRYFKMASEEYLEEQGITDVLYLYSQAGYLCQ